MRVLKILFKSQIFTISCALKKANTRQMQLLMSFFVYVEFSLKVARHYECFSYQLNNHEKNQII